MNEEHDSEPQSSGPPPGSAEPQGFDPPAYPLNYYSPPQNLRGKMPQALKVILIILLVIVGLALLAFGLCLAIVSIAIKGPH